ncbi:MAG: hypothetical protein V3T72_03575, partial [Thermoanaerobaculia bacterium]
LPWNRRSCATCCFLVGFCGRRAFRSHRTSDANCDNGLFCDGAETCDAVLDCQAGTAVDCDDGVGCTDDSCTEIPTGGGGNSCCGDGVCQAPEDDLNCAIDCDTCGDGVCDPNEDSCSCAADCGAPPLTEVGLCDDNLDNDCDGLDDCGDSDCTSDPACVCTLGQSGDACTQDSECCSSKCKGNGTCR